MAASHYRVTNDLQRVELKGEEPSLDRYLEDLNKISINILTMTEEEIVFDLVGVEAPIANALRRIMLAEVIYK
jgi:hypothetical protein